MTSPALLRDPAHRVSRRAIWHWMVRYALIMVLPTTALLVGAVLLPLDHVAGLIAVAVLVAVLAFALAVTFGLPFWRYAVHRWEASGGFVFTRSGAVLREWRIVPLHRVQTVEVSQSITERVFGIARVEIRTASYAGSTTIAGLDAARARDLAAELTEALRPTSDDGA